MDQGQAHLSPGARHRRRATRGHGPQRGARSAAGRLQGRHATRGKGTRRAPAVADAGKVGIGYSEADRAMLRDKLHALHRDTSPFSGRQPVTNAIFVDPVLVAEFEFHEWTASGMLRHPSYKGLRSDVDHRAVVRESRPTRDRVDREQRAASAPPRTAQEATVEVDGRRVRLTNLGKVLYPRVG